MLFYRASLPLSRQTLNFAAGFGIGTATAWRYVEETVALLAARAPRLRKAVRDAARAGHAYVVLDGTLIPIDRVAADRPGSSPPNSAAAPGAPVSSPRPSAYCGSRGVARMKRLHVSNQPTRPPYE